jgi:hypothetical protein
MTQADRKDSQPSTTSHPLPFAALVAAYFSAFEAAETAPEDSREHVAGLRRWKTFRDRIATHSPKDHEELREKVRVLAHYDWPGPEALSVSTQPLAAIWRDLSRLAA